MADLCERCGEEPDDLAPTLVDLGGGSLLAVCDGCLAELGDSVVVVPLGSRRVEQSAVVDPGVFDVDLVSMEDA